MPRWKMAHGANRVTICDQHSQVTELTDGQPTCLGREGKRTYFKQHRDNVTTREATVRW